MKKLFLYHTHAPKCWYVISTSLCIIRRKEDKNIVYDTIILLFVLRYLLRCRNLQVTGITDRFIEVLEVKMKNLYPFTEISSTVYSLVESEVWVCKKHSIWYDMMWYDIYLLQLGFHPVAVVGKFVQKYDTVIYKRKKQYKNTKYTK